MALLNVSILLGLSECTFLLGYFEQATVTALLSPSPWTACQFFPKEPSRSRRVQSSHYLLSDGGCRYGSSKTTWSDRFPRREGPSSTNLSTLFWLAFLCRRTSNVAYKSLILFSKTRNHLGLELIEVCACHIVGSVFLTVHPEIEGFFNLLLSHVVALHSSQPEVLAAHIKHITDVELSADTTENLPLLYRL
jgi:hypothetical protein